MTATCEAPDQGTQPQANPQVAGARARPSLLVAIASYGSAQDDFLRQVVAEYLKLDMKCRIVVLSNIPKTVPGAETLVGLPSRDSYSLPFAHRKLFTDNADKFDLFIYTEDDTLITARNIGAFCHVQQYLEPGEIVGFLRSETDPEGHCYIVSANHFFRWQPETVVDRGAYRFAQFSNQHSGCFLVTRRQLASAIASGGFTLKPHADRYGMLEAAASDIYTQCGLKRVICLTRIEDFIIPHLANKYHGEMGVAVPEFLAQVQALSRLPASDGASSSLFNPETRAPDFRWSKHLYRDADQALLSLVPLSAKRVLSVGATMGANEVELRRRGHGVVALPLDPVFGAVLSRCGVEVYAGHGARAFASLAGASFDVVMASDMLHLVQDPAAFLRMLAGVLSPTGVLVASVSNTSSWLWLLRDWRHGHWRSVRPSFERYGAHPVNAGRLRQWCRACGLELSALLPEGEEIPMLAAIPWSGARIGLASHLVFQARPISTVQER